MGVSILSWIEQFSVLNQVNDDEMVEVIRIPDKSRPGPLFDGYWREVS